MKTLANRGGLVKHLAIAIIGMGALASSSHAQEWDFTPHIYARGGVTMSSDFEYRASGIGPFNFGPWREESNMIANPLTELTLEASYGDQFKYWYGIDVENNQRFINGERTQLSERINYLQYFDGDMSLWFGSRPYRSSAEYLSRAYTFDEKNLFGGGVRFERVGPTNLEFAYGTFDKEYEVNNETTTELTNVFINKVEYPLANGIVKTNLEIQQTKKRGELGTDQNTHGYMAGVSYKRWGDEIFGGGLYNQFLLHYGTGYLQQHYMVPVFSVADASGGQDVYNDDFAASKTLLQWNGDWKADRLGLYWATFYAINEGEDSESTIDSGDMKWTTLDAYVRPQYGITENVNVGFEYGRRTILEEGDGVPGWAQNSGAWRWAGMVTYHLENSYFSDPVISLFAGEMHRDTKQQFYSSRKAEHNTHFIRLNYEVGINSLR
jgi:hypothetical protein